MIPTLALLAEACQRFPSYVVSFSGGVDSTVLLDLAVRFAPIPPVAAVHVDVEAQPRATLAYVEETCRRYGVRLVVARPEESLVDRWRATGWPLQGKQDRFTASHPELGIRMSCRSCCRSQKLRPGRRATREAGATCQWVGTRGAADSQVRGTQAMRGAIVSPTRETGSVAIAVPLVGWTDCMVRRYARRHRLQLNPVSLAGGEAGCGPCGGGAQFTTSSIRRMRLHAPADWHKWIVGAGLGVPLLAVKYRRTEAQVHAALDRLGGLEAVARERPWLFDFTEPPGRVRSGYEKHGTLDR